MHIKPLRLNLKHRQIDMSTKAINTEGVDASGLAFDQGATGVPSFNVAPATVLKTQTPAPTPTPTPLANPTTVADANASPTASAASGASHGPSMTTVVAACVGAFIGASILIVTAIYMLRRYNNRQERAMRSRRAGRIAQMEKEKEEEEQDKKNDNTSRSPPRSPGAPTVGHLDMGEKIDMFQASPSLKSGFTVVGSDNSHPAAAATHNLAAKFTASQSDLASANANAAARTPAARASDDNDANDTSGPMSWHSAGEDSFLNLRTGRMSGVLAPSNGVEKMTPPVTMYGLAAGLHPGESAVVINPFTDSHVAQSAVLERGGPVAMPVPAAVKPERRPSRKGTNPFFGANSQGSISSVSVYSTRSGRSHAPADSHSQSYTYDDEPIPMNGANPFADAHAAKARALGHSGSAGSLGSNASSSSSQSEQAMQSLLMALDLPPSTGGNQADHLRVGGSETSPRQPSVYSNMTGYTMDEDVRPEEFPLPPSSRGSH
jgi:hypothetical protein